MINNIYFIPRNFKIIFLKRKIIFLMLQDIFIKLIIPINNFFKINNYSNTIFNITYSQFSLVSFFKTYSIVNLQGVKFKGKGFKLTKRHNILDFLFNYAHINYFISKETLIRKIRKNKFTLINWNSRNLQNIKIKIINRKLINIYNYNGLRLKRQIVYKRKGKAITN